MATPEYEQVLLQVEKLSWAEVQLLFEQLRTKIESYQQEMKEGGEPQPGTLVKLAKLTQEANLSFEPTDLSARTNEYLETHFADDYLQRFNSD